MRGLDTNLWIKIINIYVRHATGTWGKGKIPVQATANQLEVPNIPEPLCSLTQLEVHCISLRIPFMAIWVMPKGGLGKITGPCINVPASLEPIAEILPRVPENIQLVLVKLKRMLVYKSHYLCDYICPYVVMDALKFLKENNPHYINVKIDDTWIDKLRTDSLYKVCFRRCESKYWFWCKCGNGNKSWWRK